MTCVTNTSEVVLEAAKLKFGKEAKACIEPVLALSGGESFIVSTPSTSYQVWFDLDGGSVAPTPASGETLIEVEISTGYTLKDIVTAMKTAVETAEAFYGIKCADGECLVLEAPVIGEALTSVTDVDSGFTLTQDEVGFANDLGGTAEGSELSIENTLFDITSNENGTLILDRINQGSSVTITVGLQEVSKARLEKLIGEGYGDIFTPASGTSLVGYGTSKNFRSSLSFAGRLVLHPVRLADTDRTEDFTLWKCVPQPESINYSGTDKKVLNVTFTALRDENKPEEISVAATGDSEQFLVE
jgi:hypothetical protein